MYILTGTFDKITFYKMFEHGHGASKTPFLLASSVALFIDIIAKISP